MNHCEHKGKIALIFTKELPMEFLEELIQLIQRNELEIGRIITIDRDIETIKETLFDQCMQDFAIVFVFGALGIEADDVVPEATAAIIDKTLPGLERTIMYLLLENDEYSIVNRAVAGIFKNSIILDLPARPHLIHLILEKILMVLRKGLKYQTAPSGAELRRSYE